MLFHSDNIPSSTLDSAPQNTSPPKLNLTPSGSNEPFKIILFPPKNKEFRYDSGSNSLKVHSVNLSAIQTPASENIDTGSGQAGLSGGKSGLTPLVETCSILTEGTAEPEACSTPKLNDSKRDNVSVRELLKIEKVYRETKLRNKCYLKGCRWSPDGLCLISNSDDNALRLFEISQNVIDNPQDDLQPVFEVKEGGTIYDYEWYPLMNSSDPVSCVFASASRDAPIHLWDAYTGQLRATYQPINQFDEVTAAYSVAFSIDGSRLYTGYKKFIRIFNTSFPGRVSEERPLKHKGSPIFQTNIASSISINPLMPNLYAVGCYDKTIGLYGEPEGDLLFILKGHSGGITQLKFSTDGHSLFSGGRKDSEILCWDIRNPGKVAYSIARRVDTQQKIQFDVSRDDEYLITGTTDCHMKLYHLKSSPKADNVLEPILTWKGHDDCVNGTQFHPHLPLIASVSGQRHYHLADDSDEEEDMEEEEGSASGTTVENTLKIWSMVGRSG